MRKASDPGPRIPWRHYPWWVRTFTIIGVLAVGGVLTALFVAIGHGPHEVSATSIPPVESRDFLLGVSGIAGVPLREGGTARLLNNGDEFFPALLRAIRGATRVQVRVLLDGFGGAKAPKAGMDALRAAGGRVETFRAPRLGRFTRFHKRNHRRAIVIDGTVGYTGGIAVGDQWLGDAESEEHWRDSMAEVTGPLAATLQSAFADLWAGTSGELLRARRGDPEGGGEPRQGGGRRAHPDAGPPHRRRRHPPGEPPLLRGADGGRRPDLRVPAHDDARQAGGRGRAVVGGRLGQHGHPRQRAQRGERGSGPRAGSRRSSPSSTDAPAARSRGRLSPPGGGRADRGPCSARS